MIIFEVIISNIVLSLAVDLIARQKKMSDFSDYEDRTIFLLAKKFVDAGKKVRWDVVAKKMKDTKKSRDSLRSRFRALKNTYGTDISKFPKRFFTPMPKPKKLKKKKYDPITPVRLSKQQIEDLMKLVDCAGVRNFIHACVRAV